MHPSRVLLADDHPSLAAAIGEYVAEAFQLVGTVRDGGALFEAAKTLKPDVIVADISMPGTDGLTAMKQILKHLPHVRAILLTNYGDAEVVRHALDAGASGFVLAGC
jgi:DNA-binding NarL/FixJ family response regulator